MGSLQAAEIEGLLVANYCYMATTALVLYEFIITTGDEIQVFWTRKLTGATVLFWLNKWITILPLGLNLATYFKVSDPSCAAIATGGFILQVLLYLVWGLFTALRVYALGANWFLSLIIILLHVVPLGLNMGRFAYGLSGGNVPLFGCMGEDSTPASLQKIWTGVCRASLIMANVIAVSATWSTMGKGRNIPSERGTIANVLLWDGFIYFLVLTILDSLHLIITMLSLSQLSGVQDNSSYIAIFTSPLTTVLVSRFILHLQSANLRGMGVASSCGRTTSNNGSLVFEKVVGSLAASISPEDYFKTEGDHDDSDTLEERVSEIDGGVDLQEERA